MISTKARAVSGVPRQKVVHLRNQRLGAKLDSVFSAIILVRFRVYQKALTNSLEMTTVHDIRLEVITEDCRSLWRHVLQL